MAVRRAAAFSPKVFCTAPATSSLQIIAAAADGWPAEASGADGAGPIDLPPITLPSGIVCRPVGIAGDEDMPRGTIPPIPGAPPQPANEPTSTIDTRPRQQFPYRIPKPSADDISHIRFVAEQRSDCRSESRAPEPAAGKPRAVWDGDMVCTQHNDQVVARLRRYTSADAAWYAETARDPKIQRFTSDPGDLSAEAVRRAISDSASNPDHEAFLVCGSADSERLANVAIELTADVAELSYWVAPDARGRGVARRAIELACGWLRTYTDVDRAVLWTAADNVASRKSAERAGFRLTELSRRTLRGRVVESAEYELALHQPRTDAMDTSY